MRYDYAIIGGGASGLMLGALADLNKCKANGVILEATAVLGSKILMSGGGHCNITHAGSIKDFIPAYGDAGKFLRKALYRHNNLELIKWLEEDFPTICDDNGRVFPESMRSADVLKFLLKRVKANGWEIKLNTKINKLDEIDAENIIIASGGITFQETGSDGSMLRLLAEQGITVVEPRSALAALRIKDYPYSELAGISLDDVSVSVYSRSNNAVPDTTGFACSRTIPSEIRGDGKFAVNEVSGRAARMQGALLFTHEGFSGPVVLNISKYAKAGEFISIDYKRQLEELPKRLQKSLIDRARGDSGDVRTKALSGCLTNDKFVIDSIDRRGMVTCGGIALEEINPATMEIRPGLYAIGEAINADGITGGYNLQMCYSTAAMVADTIMKERLV